MFTGLRLLRTRWPMTLPQSRLSWRSFCFRLTISFWTQLHNTDFSWVCNYQMPPYSPNYCNLPEMRVTPCDNTYLTPCDNSYLAPCDNRQLLDSVWQKTVTWLRVTTDSYLAPCDNTYLTPCDNSYLTPCDNRQLLGSVWQQTVTWLRVTTVTWLRAEHWLYLRH
jgi:hypothetical protein